MTKMGKRIGKPVYLGLTPNVMSFFKNLISSALGTFIALGLLFVFLFVFIAGSIAMFEEDSKAVEIENNTVLVLNMKVPIQDREPQSFSFSGALELDPEAYGLNAILPAIAKAAEDERISGISIQNMSALGGIANISAVRNALATFKESGKFVYAYKHLDTLELWKFGDYKHYTSLKLLAHFFDIPSPKDDMEGSDVAKVYHEQNDLIV